jgi:hypothetical protein
MALHGWGYASNLFLEAEFPPDLGTGVGLSASGHPQLGPTAIFEFLDVLLDRPPTGFLFFRFRVPAAPNSAGLWTSI